MSQLPTRWERRRLDERDLLLGIFVNNTPAEYCLYLIDLVNAEIWAETNNSAKIEEQLNSQGFLELDAQAIEYFLKNLVEDVYENLDLEKEQDSFKGQLKTKRLSWNFKLERQTELNSQILSQLMLQQIGNFNQLQHKYNDLVDLILQKDKYIKYLSEMYKGIGKEEELTKYKKHVPDQSIFDSFNESSWNQQTSAKYTQDDTATSLQNAFNSREPLPSNSQLPPTKPTTTVKKEPEDDFEPKVKKESSTPSPSPKKRKRQGLFTSKK